MSDSFRCEACKHTSARCELCRAARAAYMRDLRAARRVQARCYECDELALEGQTRCAAHQARNAAASSVSHVRRRAQQRDE